VVGSQMARKLNLRLGKKVIYTVTDKYGELASEIARVSGIFKTATTRLTGQWRSCPLAG